MERFQRGLTGHPWSSTCLESPWSCGCHKFSLGRGPAQPAGHWAALTSWAAAGTFQTAPGAGQCQHGLGDSQTLPGSLPGQSLICSGPLRVAVPEPRCEQSTNLAGSAATRAGLGPCQELLAQEEGDHAPAPLPEEQHRSQPGPLIIAGCSQMVPVTNKTAPGTRSAADRGVGSPRKGGNKASSPAWIRAHPELPMATAKLQRALCWDVAASSSSLTLRETFSWVLDMCCPEGRSPGTGRGQCTSPLQTPDPTQVAAGSTWGRVGEELQGALT